MSAKSEGLEPDPRTDRRPETHLRKWGAVYLLLLLFLGSWIGQFFTQLAEFRSEQSSHGQRFEWGSYLTTFFSSTFENWQSEWLQLVFQAVLLLGAKHLIFRVDAEDLERLEAKVDRIARVIVPDRDEGEHPLGVQDPEPPSDTDDQQTIGLRQVGEETSVQLDETELIPKSVEDLRGLTGSDNDTDGGGQAPDVRMGSREYWAQWRHRWKWSVLVTVWAMATVFAFNGAFDSFGPMEWVVGTFMSVVGSGLLVGTVINFAVAALSRPTPRSQQP